ncbi:hypothetical protein clP1_041 [Pediococcus phage cIP1]|uniref:Uncharacterized protein n=1 Tax=Pediococcus phage cIP1 TaxID=2681621 RepID=G8FV24_9CAUD|nr:hypothetical protein clP1_041 [Pediococcus phage cIP1]AER59800.1 hypothetical protein clP1_041 [Pediococcus phage cIP1]
MFSVSLNDEHTEARVVITKYGVILDEFKIYRHDNLYWAVVLPESENDPVPYYKTLDETLNAMKTESKDFYGIN